MDVTFYSLDFTERHILPASSRENGYISMTGVKEFCGNGSFQLSFNDDIIKTFVKAHSEGYFIKWGRFEGYASDFQFIDAESKCYVIYGSHLNGLLNKVLFPPQNINAETVNSVMSSLIAENIPWLIYDTFDGDVSVDYVTDTYMEADRFIEEYFGEAKLGYQVYIKDETLHFKILSSTTNSLVFSKGNRNVYEIQEDFSNKDTAYGGWYKKAEEDDGTKVENEEWVYITSEAKEGLYKRDILLSATSPGAARNELIEHKDKHTTVCKTKNVAYGDDYNLGDVVRLQIDDKTIKKQVSSVDMWFEGASYHEEPLFTDWEE